MADIELLPVAVLVVGIAVGLAAAFRLRRGAPADTSARALQVADLRQQRDEIYAKLRGQDGELPQDEDRAVLEQLAARILKDLDQLERAEPKQPGRLAAQTEKPEPEPARVGANRRGWIDQHPLLAGSLLGGGLVTLVAILVFWALSDARPDPAGSTAGPTGAQAGPFQASGQTGSVPPGSAPGEAGFDRGEPPLPPEIQAQVDAIRARLVSSPEDLDLRHELTQLLLAHGHFFDAFAEAQAILSRRSEDPLGTYVVGVVRYTMGQPEEALSWLERSINSDPTFIQASLVRGILLLQIGDREGAIDSWQRGLDAVGGQEPRLERLLTQAREGKTVEEILQAPPG